MEAFGPLSAVTRAHDLFVSSGRVRTVAELVGERPAIPAGNLERFIPRAELDAALGLSA